VALRRPDDTSPECFPRFGSVEHCEWLSRRLERNLLFRQQQDAFAQLGEFMHRRTARESIGGRRAVA
jgi:hypothetical protein